MSRQLTYIEAREVLLDRISAIDLEEISLRDCAERILAQDVVASENVPSFDRSPYDGYAFRSVDSKNASQEHPVTLKILEEISAGSVPHYKVSEGTAVKVLTGAPIPEGADAVTMFEVTEFTEETVTIFQSMKSGSNIIYAGEDVKKGEILGIVGKNGSGKSTMLRAIAGIFAPNSGTVDLHGNSISLLAGYQFISSYRNPVQCLVKLFKIGFYGIESGDQSIYAVFPFLQHFSSAFSEQLDQILAFLHCPVGQYEPSCFC